VCKIVVPTDTSAEDSAPSSGVLLLKISSFQVSRPFYLEFLLIFKTDFESYLTWKNHIRKQLDVVIFFVILSPKSDNNLTLNVLGKPNNRGGILGWECYCRCMTVELVSSVYATGLESHFENHPFEVENINKTGPSVYPFLILFYFTIKGER
jgi:hypothetical protein